MCFNEFIIINSKSSSEYIPALVVVYVLVYFATLHIKHINEHFNIAKNIVALSWKVMLHKRLLTTAVPQI